MTYRMVNVETRAELLSAIDRYGRVGGVPGTMKPEALDGFAFSGDGVWQAARVGGGRYVVVLYDGEASGAWEAWRDGDVARLIGDVVTGHVPELAAPKRSAPAPLPAAGTRDVPWVVFGALALVAAGAWVLWKG